MDGGFQIWACISFVQVATYVPDILAAGVVDQLYAIVNGEEHSQLVTVRIRIKTKNRLGVIVDVFNILANRSGIEFEIIAETVHKRNDVFIADIGNILHIGFIIQHIEQNAGGTI